MSTLTQDFERPGPPGQSNGILSTAKEDEDEDDDFKPRRISRQGGATIDEIFRRRRPEERAPRHA